MRIHLQRYARESSTENIWNPRSVIVPNTYLVFIETETGAEYRTKSRVLAEVRFFALYLETGVVPAESAINVPFYLTPASTCAPPVELAA